MFLEIPWLHAYKKLHVSREEKEIIQKFYYENIEDYYLGILTKKISSFY